MRIRDWSSDVCSSDLFVHRIDGADIIDDAVPERDGQLLALREHVGDALVRGVAAGEHLAVEEDAVALLPARDHLGGQRVEVDALRRAVGRPVDRSEEHTSELQSLMRLSYAVF